MLLRACSWCCGAEHDHLLLAYLLRSFCAPVLGPSGLLHCRRTVGARLTRIIEGIDKLVRVRRRPHHRDGHLRNA